MRVLALLLPALFAASIALHGQTQSIQYEMKLLRVYQNYPHDDPGGPDITWKARAILNGMGPNPIAGPTGQLHLPNMQSTGWFDVPGMPTIALGTTTYAAGNTFNLCGDNITVNIELDAWEDDCGDVFHFQNLCDGHRFGAYANGVGNPKINEGSGVTRVFQLVNWNPNNFQNPYYGFEVSITYTLTNGIREVVYAGNTSGGPVADVCEGSSYYVFARTEPGFSGGDFEFQRSDNNGATWTTVQTGASPAYLVTASANPNILYRVRLRGGFGCLGYAGNDGWVAPAGAGNLRIIPTFGASDISYSVQSSCEGDAGSSITVSSINNLPPNISVTMQLNAPDDPFFVSPNPGLVTLPYTWQNLEPGRYRLNVTGVLINGENLPTGQCTQDIFIEIAPVALPVFTGLIPANPGCGETTGSVSAIISSYTSAFSYAWQVFAVGNTTTPVATGNQQASSVQFGNLAPGDYFVRLTLNGTCVVDSAPVVIAAPPAPAGGTAQVIYPGAATTVLCPDGKATINLSAAVGTGQNTVRVYFTAALNNLLATGPASPGSPFSTLLSPGNYTAVFQRDDNGCQAFVNFTVANPNNVLAVAVAATQTPPPCTPLGGSLTLNVSGGTAPYTFVINGVARTPNSVSGANRVFTGLPTGKGLYEVTDANGCKRTAYYTIAENAFPNLSIFITVDPEQWILTCNGGNDGWLAFHPEGGPWWLGYQVKINELDADYGPVTNWSSENPVVRTGLAPGAYTIYAKDANGCETARVAVIEEFPSQPMQITRVEIDPIYCGPSSTRVAIYATGFLLRNIANQPPSIFFSQDPTNPFFFGAGWTPDPNDPNGIIVYRDLFPGTYNFQLRQSKGINFVINGTNANYAPFCFTNVVSVTAADFNVPTPVAVTTQVVSPTCNGETNGSLTVNFTGGNPGYELQLVRFGTLSPPGNPTVVQTVVLSGNAPGTYTFTGLSAGSYGVRVRTAIVDGGATNLPGSCTRYFPGNWSTNQNFAPYTLSNPTPISINTINTTTPLQCDLTGGQITVQSVSGGTPPYQYSVNGVDFSTSNVLPALSQNTVYVRDANSCQATTTYSVTQVITSSLSLSFAATPPANCILQGLGTFTITPGTPASPPYRVEYASSMSGGQLVNPVIIQTSDLILPVSGLAPGSLFVKITDAAQCTKSFTFSVTTVPASPLTAITSAKTQQSCPEINNGALTITAQGGIPPYQIVYNGVAGTGATRMLSNLGPGTYLFDITDAAGCFYTHQETIEAATVIRHTQSYTPVGPCTDSGNGSVTISPQGGQPPYTITWQDGAPSQTVGAGGIFTRNNLNRTEYIFTITGAGAGCELVSSIYPPGPDVPFEAALGTVSQPQCAGVDNGSVTIQVTGGTGPYTYSSDGGSTFQPSATFAGLSAGTYNFIARDAAGCERAVNNVQINNTEAVSAGISTVAVPCFGGNSGSITVTPSGGTGPYTLSVNGSAPSSNLTASNLTGGIYSVVVSDVNGCLFSDPAVVVTQPDALTLMATPVPPLCNGSTGSISLSATGGTGIYEYRLVGGTYSNNNVLSNLAVGNYDVQVRDANGCETTVLNVAVSQPPLIVIQLQNTTPDYCFRADGTATVSATGGTGVLMYAWSNGDTGPTATDLSAGDATVSVTDQNNCTITLVVNIVAVPFPTITGIAVQDAICTNDNGTAELSFTGGTGMISINWSNGGMGANLSGLSAGNYTATVTDAVGCSVSQTAIVGFVPAHTLSTTQSDENCDQGNGSITVNVSGGSGNFTYTWPAGVSAAGNMAQNLSGGVYVITVTDNTRGCVVSTSVTLNNTPALTATFNVSNVLCNGQSSGSITAVPTTGTAPFFISVNGGAPVAGLTASGLAAGTYAIVVSDVNGCFFSDPAVTVGEPAALTLGATPSMPACFGGNDGSIALSANGGTGAYEYRLVGGTYSNNPVISNLSAGMYAVQVRDANGCETTLSNVIVTQPPAVEIQLDATTPEFCNRADGTATVSASGGTGMISINWSNGQSGPTATGLAAGAYSVTATDANGCTADIQNITITETPPVTLGIAELLHSLCDEGNGQITVSVADAPGPFIYVWSHDAGLNSPTAAGLNSGSYTVTVTDGNNCSAEISATVLLRPRPVLAPPVVTLAACMGNTGSVQVSVQSGGTAPFMYAWSHNPGLNSNLASNLFTGTYTCTVTDFYGCMAEVTAFVGELPPPQATVSVNTATCSLPNGSAQVSAFNGTAPYSYAWSHGAPNSPNAQNLAAGDYTVTVTDFYGCQGEQSFTVGNIPGPSALNINFQHSICFNSNGAINVTPVGGTAPFQYAWSHNPFLNSPSAVQLLAGNYSVTVTDANGCTISAQQTILLQLPPVIQTLQQVNSLCVNGTGIIEIAATGTGPFTYAWTNGVSTGPLAQNLNVGNYTVTVTDANGCTATRSFTIAFEPPPAILLISQTNDICGQGLGSIRVRLQGGRLPATFSWSHSPSLNSDWPVGLFAGIYTVTVTDANGCTAMAQYTVTETPGPNLAVTAVGTAFCGDAIGFVEVQPTGGLAPFSYAWSHNPGLNSALANNLLPGAYSVTVTDANNCTATANAVVGGTTSPTLFLISTSENPCVANDASITMGLSGDFPPYTFSWSHNAGLNSLTATGLPTGVYSITATDANGCQAIFTTNVTDQRGPTLQVANVVSSSCGFADGSATLSATLGLMPYTYTWSHNPALNSPTASNLSAGIYSATVTDANGCSAQVSLTVSDSQGPQVSVTNEQDALCTPDNGSMSVSASGGLAPYTYSWSHNPGLNSATATGLAPGAYSITVTDANGCQAITSGSIGLQAGPTATATVNDAVCEPNTGSISVQMGDGAAPFNITWNIPALSGFNPTQVFAGNYTATITDANGCEIMLTVGVNFIPGPTLVLVQQNDASCGQSDGYIEVGEIGGQAPYTYAWSHDLSLNYFAASNLAPGVYSATVTDANGCVDVYTTTINDAPGADLSLSTVNSACGQQNGSAVVNAAGGTAPYTYLWSHNPALNSAEAENLMPGIYSVTVTDANGCSGSVSGEIEDEGGAELSVSSFSNAVCQSNSGSISLSISGGQAPYLLSWSHNAGLDSLQATGLGAGTYSVTATDANGCQSVASQTLTFTAGPQLVLQSATNSVCEDGNGALSFSASGGTGTLSYQWSHNANLNAATAVGLSAGTYTVTVTDANGCTATQSAQVNLSAGPQLSIAAQTDTYCDNNAGAISLAVSGGAGPMQYVWSHNAGLNAANANGLSAGVYGVTVTDSNGCSSELIATVANQPGFSLDAPAVTPTTCNEDNGQIQLMPNGGQGPLAYQWSHDAGLNAPIASNLPVGIYTATVTDTTGCMQTISISVQTTDGPVLSIAQLENATCGEDNGSIGTALSGGQGPFNYLWSNGMTGSSISNLPGGNYQVTVTDANGCEGVAFATLSTGTTPTLLLLETVETGCTTAIGALEFGASGGQFPYTYTWSHDAALNAASASGLAAGSYSITLTDAAGCTAAAVAEVTAPTDLSLDLVETESALCSSATGSATVAGLGGEAPYNFAWSHDAGLNSAAAAGLTAGNYSVTITDAAGCVAETALVVGVENITIDMVVLQTTLSACNAATGMAILEANGGTSPYIFSWSHDAGLSDGAANNLASGSYTATVTDANGCTGVISFSIGQTAAPQTVLVEAMDSDCNQATGSIEVSATGGQGPYLYTWSHDAGLNAGLATGLATGTYTVTTTDANGCEGTLTISVSESGAPTVSVVTTLSWCGQATGTATVPETGIFNYAWERATQAGLILSTTATATGLAAGTYSVTVTNEQGCSSVRIATIQDLPDMVLNVSSTPALCFGQSNGTAGVTLSGGAGPYQLEWSNGMTGELVSGLSAGAYTVTATDANGCISIRSISVTQPAQLSVALASSANPQCSASTNGSIAVQVSGGTGTYQYLWSSGQQTASITGLSAGTYGLTVSDANGCEAIFGTTLNATGTLNFDITTTAQSCASTSDGQASVAVAGNGPFSYQWNAPGNPTGSSAGNLPPGTYSVTVSNATGCAAAQSFQIAAAPAIELQVSTTPSCLNELNGTATATAQGGAGSFTYNWSNLQTGASVSNLLPGVYSVSATDANGCTQSELVIVDGAPFPTLEIVDIISPDCSGQNPGSAEVLATGGTGMITYQWNDPQSQTGASAVNLNAGSYLVTATDENGCSAFISVEVIPPADFLLSPGAVSDPACFGTSDGSAVAVVQGGSGNFTYLWNDPQGQSGPQAQNLVAGSYTVSVTDNVSGCTQTTTVNLTDPPLLQLSVANATDVPCAGESSGSATLSASGGTGSYSFQWNDPAGQTGTTATGLSAGVYQAVLMDANGCTASAEVEINEPPALVVQIDAFVAPLCFGQANGSATAGASGGTGSYIFQWNDPAMQTTATAANLTSGSYAVTIRDANNCEINISVVIPDTPPVVIEVTGQSAPLCAGESNGSLSVSATGGTGALSYQWSSGQNGPALSDLPAGEYTVSVTDANGCVEVLTLPLLPAAEIEIQITEATPPICANENTGRIEVVASGGSFAFSYLWSNGAEGAEIAQLAGGQSYQVTATNAVGCSQTITVDLPGGAIVDVSALPNSVTLCTDDVFVLDLEAFATSQVSGPGGFSDSGRRVLLEAAGLYAIAVVSQEGCRDTVALNLAVTTDLLVAAMVLPSDVVVGDSVVVLETSWPAPETVSWVFDNTRAQLLRQEQNQYWFMFSEPDRYTLSMIARQGGCEDIITKEIVVHADSSSLPSVYLGPLEILSASVNPNPNNGLFQAVVQLSGPNTLFVSLYNASGMLLDRRRGEGLSGYSFDFDLRGQAGTYVLLVQTARDRRTLTVLVVE
jgi:large repetitive protein